MSSTALASRIDQLHTDVARLAQQVARAILEAELARRYRSLAAAPRARRGAAARRPAKVRTAKPARQGRRTAAAHRPSATPAPAPTRGRAGWTRDQIVDELARWLAKGTTADAAFVTRHGPKGLVAASKRIFGRFEAALNVAALRASELYPPDPDQPLKARLARRS